MFFKIVLYHHFFFFFFYQFTAHDKKTKIDKYVTGNPVNDTKPVLTPNEEKLLEILGESPGMKGIRKRSFDTPIVINTSKKKYAESTVLASRAQGVSAMSPIEEAINSGTRYTLCLFKCIFSLRKIFCFKIRNLFKH